MNVRKIMLVVTLGMFLSASAFAQQQPPSQGGGAQKQGGAPQGQAGGQGGGSSDGVKLDMTPFITAVDTNKDGKVTAEEWKAAGLPENVYEMFDKDKKGITKESMADKTHPPTIDSNKDGKLSLDELKAHIKSQQAQSSGGASGGAAPAGSAPGGAPKK